MIRHLSVAKRHIFLFPLFVEAFVAFLVEIALLQRYGSTRSDLFLIADHIAGADCLLSARSAGKQFGSLSALPDEVWSGIWSLESGIVLFVLVQERPVRGRCQESPLLLAVWLNSSRLTTNKKWKSVGVWSCQKLHFLIFKNCNFANEGWTSGNPDGRFLLFAYPSEGSGPGRCFIGCVEHWRGLKIRKRSFSTGIAQKCWSCSNRRKSISSHDDFFTR